MTTGICATMGPTLAALLYRLRHKEPQAYDMIVRTVRLVAPFFDDFVLEPQALNEDKVRLEWRHRGSDAYFDASSLSDGSLRFIALATLLLQPTALQPPVILLDEPELGLHPYAITILCSLVKQCSVDKQIVLATQAPLIVDQSSPLIYLLPIASPAEPKSDALSRPGWPSGCRTTASESFGKKMNSAAVPSRRQSGRIAPDDSTARPCRGRDRGDVRQGVARASSPRAGICASRPALDGQRAQTKSAGRSQTMAFGLPGHREPTCAKTGVASRRPSSITTECRRPGRRHGLVGQRLRSKLHSGVRKPSRKSLPLRSATKWDRVSTRGDSSPTS